MDELPAQAALSDSVGMDELREMATKVEHPPARRSRQRVVPQAHVRSNRCRSKRMLS